MKPWLDVRTLAKIEICGYYDFLDALQHEIDISQIPEEYGGQCKLIFFFYFLFFSFLSFSFSFFFFVSSGFHFHFNSLSLLF